MKLDKTHLVGKQMTTMWLTVLTDTKKILNKSLQKKKNYKVDKIEKGAVLKFNAAQLMPRKQAKKFLTTLAFLSKEPSSETYALICPLTFAHETKQQFQANIK